MKDGFELIEDFLAGKLNAREEKAFRLRMETEPEFANKVAAQKETHQVVELYAKYKTKEKVKAIHTKIKRKQLSFPIKIYSIAASIAVLIVIGNLWYATKTYSDKALIAHFHKLPEPTLRDTGVEQENLLINQLSEAYSTKDYNKAIALWSKVSTDSSYEMAQFHLGHLYLKTGASPQAIEVLNSLQETGDKRYMEDVDWLLAMAYLQNNEETKALTQLEKIVQNPGHSLYSQAKEMQSKLTSNWRKLVF